MITFDTPQPHLYIDIQSEWFQTQFLPLLDEYFPNRVEYWEPHDLFPVPSNQTIYLVRPETLEDTLHLRFEELPSSYLDGTVLLERGSGEDFITPVLWALIQKGVLEIPPAPVFFYVGW